MKNKYSNFLEEAYKYNKVRDVSEAFIEYPVEEEWHKGRIDNIIKDGEIPYVISYEVGDIVFVGEYRYSNGKIGKNHLFVIVEQNNVMIPIENFGMLISSNLNKLKFKSNKFLKKDNVNNLDRNSIVKTDVLYKIAFEQILFKIGKVDTIKIEEYKMCFLNNLRSKK